MEEIEKRNTERKKAICLTYRIKGVGSIREFEEKWYNYQEWFVPYTCAELEKMPFFDKMSEEFKVLVRQSKDENFELLLEGNYRLVDEEMILPDTANILMDAVYCLGDYLWAERGYNFWRYVYNRYGLRYRRNHNHWRYSLYYLGLYTEFIKYEVLEKKNRISVLTRLIGVLDDDNEPLVKSVFKEYKDKCLLGVNINESVSTRESMKECLFKLCSNNIPQTRASNFTIEVDFSDFNMFVSLLSKYRKLGPPKTDYINGNPCFCMAHKGDDQFFSLSGYSKNCDDLAAAIKRDLDNFFHRNYTYCKLCDEMLSYGYKGANNQFVPFPSPILYKDRDDKRFTEDDFRWQYSCCERKIFCKVQDYDETLFMYCKYMSCSRCIPAVQEEQKRRSGGLYFSALMKEPKSIKKLMSSGGRMFLKNGGIYLLYPW